MAKILLVEDDKELAGVIADSLTGAHYLVDAVHTLSDAVAYTTSIDYDLIVLDWQLPDGSGLDFLLEYRRRQGVAAVLMLTGRSETPDKITGLDAGADDYLTKPFDMRELHSRVRALLRRPPVTPVKTLKVRDIELDPVQHAVTMKGQEIKLYPKEFSLLELFMLHPKKVFSADDLLDKVWPTDSEASVETVRQTILRLRQKVEKEGTPALILTVRGFGYRLEP
ncbi:MAG TPA: response regulator transcription factor [Candidatus Obscuribacterales bacterium]